MRKPRTRMERIVAEYFAPYNRTITNDDLDFVMEFVKVVLIKAKRYKPGEYM
jgi:hypothetical protein